MDQDFVAFELVLSTEFASADVTQVRPFSGVSLVVDGELRLAFKLFATKVAEQRARPLRLHSALHVGDLLVMLQVVGSHVGFGTEVAAVRFNTRVNDLMCL